MQFTILQSCHVTSKLTNNVNVVIFIVQAVWFKLLIFFSYSYSYS